MRDLPAELGWQSVRDALELAAVTGGNLLLIGTKMARPDIGAFRLTSILPPLTDDEVGEVTENHRRAGICTSSEVISHRPMRIPHYTASDAGMYCGGLPPRGGEVTLAHHGVLILDEIAEFRRSTLELVFCAYKQGEVTRSYNGKLFTFPSQFQIVATTSDCPCGRQLNYCDCSEGMKASWKNRLERFANYFPIQTHVPWAPESEFYNGNGEDSATVQKRVISARLAKVTSTQLPLF